MSQDESRSLNLVWEFCERFCGDIFRISHLAPDWLAITVAYFRKFQSKISS
jgi:hypothetical protein